MQRVTFGSRVCVCLCVVVHFQSICCAMNGAIDDHQIISKDDSSCRLKNRESGKNPQIFHRRWQNNFNKQTTGAINQKERKKWKNSNDFVAERCLETTAAIRMGHSRSTITTLSIDLLYYLWFGGVARARRHKTATALINWSQVIASMPNELKMAHWHPHHHRWARCPINFDGRESVNNRQQETEKHWTSKCFFGDKYSYLSLNWIEFRKLATKCSHCVLEIKRHSMDTVICWSHTSTVDREKKTSSRMRATKHVFVYSQYFVLLLLIFIVSKTIYQAHLEVPPSMCVASSRLPSHARCHRNRNRITKKRKKRSNNKYTILSKPLRMLAFGVSRIRETIYFIAFKW